MKKFSDFFILFKLVCKLILSKINYLFINKSVVGFLIDTSQGKFIISPQDLGVGYMLLKNDFYGLEELNLIYRLCKPTDNVLFIGAHIGSLAIPTSKKVNHVTAIEANPNTYKLFLMNILINEIKNITPLHLAASNKKESITFLLSKVNSGGSKRMPKIKKLMYFFDSPDFIKVKANRLDSILRANFDSIFMDIEGSEFFALQGMPILLSRSKFLFIEFLPHHLKNVSGVTISQFLECITPFFSFCYIPSKKMIISNDKFLEFFQLMYDKDENDYAIVFSKKKIAINL